MAGSASQNQMEVNLNAFTTPMLDMAFQLLAFFVMFYKPGLLVEGYVSGKLLPAEKPAVQNKNVKNKDVKPEEKTDIPPDDVKDRITLFLRAVAPGQQEGDRSEGELSMIQMKTKVDDQPVTIADSTVTVAGALKRLKDRLKKIRDGPSGEATTIQLQPDANLKYEHVVTVWNVCRTSKFNAIGFGAPANAAK